MTSFGDDYEEAENCGVDFDYTTCYNNGLDGEDLGECEEDDQRCIARLDLQRKKVSIANSLKSRDLSKTFGTEDGRTDLLSRQMSMRSAGLTQAMAPTPEPGFEGLPKDYFRKHYQPDYPAELQMKQVCTSKALRRRTLGVTRTQPRAVFVPSRTAFDSTELKSILVPPSNSATATCGTKNIAISNVVTSITKLAGEQGFALDDSSPLQENRLPPPVVSSSDEVVVDWIESHNVQMMFEYFLALCVIHQPSDPWAFISELCSKMMEARTDLGAFDNLPRVLTPEHTEAIFRIYDRIENGYITVPQYKSAMDAMGLSRYSTNPEGWEENAISKGTFVKEATDAIDGLLRTFMVFEQLPTEETEASKSNLDLRQSKSAINVNRPVSYSGSTSSSSAGEYESNSRSGTGTGSDNADSPGATANEPQLQLQF